MALSTMRSAMRPILRASQSLYLNPAIYQGQQKAAMATAEEEMKEYWAKNHKLGRPVSPWTVYKFELPMTSSLTHRITGVVMGVSLYTMSIGLAVAPVDFTTCVEFVQAYKFSPALMFPVKMVAAFPLVYHYFNGMRHLAWDAGKGLDMKTQYTTGKICFATSFTVAALLASLSYWAI